MFSKKVLIILFAGFFLWTTPPAFSELIFKSGFDPGTYTTMDATEQRAKDIRGYDSTTGYDWEDDLEAEGRSHFMNYVDNTNGANPSMLGAYIDEDPDQPGNRVFYTWQNGAEKQSGGYWSRVQTRINNCDFKETYLKMRVRLGSEFTVVNNKDWWIWCDLFSINPKKDDGYSLSIRLVRDTVLKWGMYRKNKYDGPTHYLTSKKVEYEKWLTMEFYAKSGDVENGRFWLAIDGEKLIDEQVRTSETDDVWENMRFFKLYGEIVDVITDPEKGGKESVRVWWDDFEIWDSEPVTTFISHPSRHRKPFTLPLKNDLRRTILINGVTRPAPFQSDVLPVIQLGEFDD